MEHEANVTDGLYHTYEGLYVTKNGRYFIDGYGGAATRYSKSTNDGWSTSGGRIVPLSESEAKSFAERMDIDPRVYEEFFGKAEEA